MRSGTTFRAAGAAATAGLVLIGLAGCSGGGDGTDGDDDAVDIEPITSITVPPERLTPFCEAMIALTDRLLTDPPDDSNRLIVETYTSLLDVVPEEIEAEFAAVLDSLRTGRPATVPTDPPTASVPPSTAPVVTDASGSTVAADRVPVADEAFVDDDPTRRVNDYVQFSCRDTTNNPGPPPTQPDEVPEDTVEGS